MGAWLPLVLGLGLGQANQLGPIDDVRVNSNCAEIETALQAAYRGESYEGETVKTAHRVVTLLDNESDPSIPDFLCSVPIHITASGIKLIGQGDVLIKLADHANAPIILVGTSKSIPGDQYLALSDEEKNAMRISQVHIENLRLDGNRVNQDHECWTYNKCDDWNYPLGSIRNNGVTVRYSDHVTILNMKVKSTISGGFVAERFSNNLFVDGYQSDDNFYDGFTAYQTTNSYFRNLSLNKNLAAGISLDLDVISNTFMNVSIKDTGDVGIFARAVHNNYFKNFNISNPGNHGIFLARHPRENAPPDIEGQIPWDTATGNLFEDLTVTDSRHGAGIRVNDAECVGNRLTRYKFEHNASGDISLAREGMLLVDQQENRRLKNF